MGPLTMIAVYLICWWLVLFVVLPLGMDQGARERPTDSGFWGAPAKPDLKRKLITTTWLSALVWLVVVGVLQLNLIPVPDLSGAY